MSFNDDILGTIHEARVCISFVNRITVIVLDFSRAELEVANAVGAQSPESILPCQVSNMTFANF